MIENAGCIAWSVNVRAGMPPRPRAARLASKKGSEILFATKIDVSVALQRGMTALGSARTSKT
eukprot:10341105-Heterocapsa_arctica.AAC.1